MDKKTLYTPVYSGEIEQSVFREIVGCLDHVTPYFVSRVEYTGKQGDILVEIDGDTSGKQYKLFLPEDLAYIELLPLIDILNKKFDIEKYAKFDELLVQTKVAIAYLLREKGGEKELHNYIVDSGISQELQEKIRAIDLMQNYTQSIQAIDKFDPDVDTELSLANIYVKEFEKTFLLRGIDLLRGNLRTFTQADVGKLKGKKGKIGQRVDKNQLDEDQRLLRDAIEIDYYKDILETLRLSGDHNKIAEGEREICTIILNELQKYPYQSTDDATSYSPSKILITKQMQCLGFSFVVHAFLEELGIDHSSIIYPDHISVGVHIGNKNYSLDAAGNIEDLQEYIISGSDIKLGGNVYKKHNGEIYEQEITDGLFASLYFNLSHLHRNGEREQSLLDRSDCYDDLSLCNINKQIDECFETNNFTRWSQLCNDFLDKHPGNIDMQISKAQMLHLSGNSDESKRLLWSIIWENPKTSKAYEFLSDISLEEKHTALAQIFDYISLYFKDKNTAVTDTDEITIIQNYLKLGRYDDLYTYLQELREEDISNFCLL